MFVSFSTVFHMVIMTRDKNGLLLEYNAHVVG